MNSRDEGATSADLPVAGEATSDSAPPLSGGVARRATDTLGAARAAVREAGHVAFPDGVRGLAALYVVSYHIWLTTYPTFPHDSGPAWASWMVWGHLAVSLFIVVSGFSLTLASQRNGDRLPGGFSTYIRRDEHSEFFRPTGWRCWSLAS